MRRQHVELGGWSAEFEPRDIDIAGADTVVLTEVWTRNDYRVDLATGLSGTVIDVGANIGAFTVLASLAGAERVVAIEPQADNFERLRHHVALNMLPGEVLLHQAAVAPPDVRHVQIVGEGGGAQISRMPIQLRDPAMEPWVNALDLHLLIDEYAPVSFLKVDIEGGEYPVFNALDVRQLAYVDRIAMEWHGPTSPHLDWLRGDEFGPLVTKLADAGRVETFGHPYTGGLLWWEKY